MLVVAESFLHVEAEHEEECGAEDEGCGYVKGSLLGFGG